MDKKIIDRSDCKYLVNYNECCFGLFECNGCMECKDYEPRPSLEEQANQE